MAVLCWSRREEILHAQGKRNPSKMVDVARGHQRADTLKPYSPRKVTKKLEEQLEMPNGWTDKHLCSGLPTQGKIQRGGRLREVNLILLLFTFYQHLLNFKAG